ncbi:sigma-54 dependent transcriptional regulator [Terasakiella sp. SH-1]|uniref:sigma-54-dependent transcriptional regulator n=1 Tax=Terasakiella sp. SH-1 TaxID=2560057 RepID=UPI001074048C|nr:sigma-54 dependent transcriptional regulator [Terasakiella sp. SH-1]
MSESNATILVIDDELRSLETLERTLSFDFTVFTASSVSQAREILNEQWIQVILCDQLMPEMTGVEFLQEVREKWPETIRIIISGYTEAEDIITGINKAGIYQYITKPWQPDKLILTLQNAVQLFDLQRQNELLAIELKMTADSAKRIMDSRRQKLKDAYQDDNGIIRAQNSPMDRVCDQIQQIAGYDVSVLLCGESGTGKELAARALHYNSLRWDKAFVVENCGALPDELLESELFGHKKGAFTGAVNDHTGLFERADGGTVFLDEIGEVSQAFQVKLLRVLQEGEIRPVGATRTRKIDVRVIAATNRDLEQEVREGRFRKDLYFRLAAMIIQLPPLHERRNDIPVLANYLLDQAMSNLGKKVSGISQEAMNCLKAYHWSGNVRELQNEVQRMLVMAREGEMLGAELLSPRVLMSVEPEEQQEMSLLNSFDGTLKERIENIEVKILYETLVRHRWNKTKAAEELGLSRVGLRGKLERYGLEKVELLPAAETSNA